MIGNVLIIISLIASMLSMFNYYKSYKGFNTLKNARLFYHSMTISIVLSSAFLLYAILTHQYQFKYVFEHSNADLSTGLLISSFFAGQEGSLLLWLLFTSLIGLILINVTSKNKELESSVMLIYTLAVSFLIIMLTPMMKSPFQYLWSQPAFIETKYFSQQYINLPAIKHFLMNDPNSNKQFININSDLLSNLNLIGIHFEQFLIKGKGLNPLLQNFWMQIHPPILFIGYAIATVPFAFAVSANMRENFIEWINEIMPWVIAGILILGLGIMIGGYWAYGVLGWGGYWAWDPVENASLIPWILLTAFLHTLLIQKKTQTINKNGMYIKTNLILAALSYIFVIYSTFLTRSGVLSDASVHSFADPGKTIYIFLLIYVMAFTVIGLFPVYLNRKKISIVRSTGSIITRESGLFYGAFSLIASATVIAVGTSAPIFGQSVETDFYNQMNLPLVIIMCLLIGLSLFLRWQSTDKVDLFKSIMPAIIAATVFTALIAFSLGIDKYMTLIFAFSIFFTIIVNFQFLIKSIRLNFLFSGGQFSHIGFAIFLMGVLTTGFFSKSQQAELIKGESKKVLNKDLTFLGYNLIENGKKYVFDIRINDGESNSIAQPVMYISDYNNSMMRDPEIINYLKEDFYISPLSFKEGTAAKNSSIISLKKGQKQNYGDYEVMFSGFDFPDEIMNKMVNGEDFEIDVKLIFSDDAGEYTAIPKMKHVNGEKDYGSASMDDIDLKVQLISLDVAGQVEIAVNLNGEETNFEMKQNESITIEASIKPFIGLVWSGIVVMAIGLTIATIRRKREL